jgi:hypothetical protein
MTREQAIRELKIQFIGEYDRQREAKDMAIKALEQESVLDKIRAEIAEYGSICVEYKLTLTDRRDKDIEQLVTDVLKQAKKQVLDIIDKYKTESEV